MNNLQLFVVGTLVTLLVTASMALLIWGAILDGRDERTRVDAEPEKVNPDRPTLHAVDAA